MKSWFFALFSVFFFLPGASAVNIVVVSDGGAGDPIYNLVDNMFMDANLSVGSFSNATGDMAQADLLTAADAIFVARDTNSGNYDDSPAEIDFWNGLEANLVLYSGYLARDNRWDYVAGSTLDNASTLTNDPESEITPEGSAFYGVQAGLHNLFDGGDLAATPRLSGAGVGDGTILATIDDSPNTNLLSAVWEAGDSPGGTASTFGGNRLLLALDSSFSDLTQTGDPGVRLSGEALVVNTILWAVPEPSRGMLLVFGAIMLVLRRTR